MIYKHKINGKKYELIEEDKETVRLKAENGTIFTKTIADFKKFYKKIK
jgi:hypothetical protein